METTVRRGEIYYAESDYLKDFQEYHPLFPNIGGCGGDWGQRLSDTAYLNMLDGTGIHVLEHEIGHGFGMTDFYGGEGESNGFPPGGFPGGENSLMMAGSAMKITDFDGWMLRYMWSKIKDEDGRSSK